MMNNTACAADVTVAVVTLNRPECLGRCMRALRSQTVRPSQVIVVDASRDDRSRRVMEAFPEVLYIAAPENFCVTPASRNRALLEARGGIIAFLDDDAYANPDWLKNILAAYDAPNVGGVGGRALNHQPGEETEGADKVGVLTPCGFLLGNFAANPGRIVEVDHLLGCNMSFRREVLEKLGGFREDFYGAISLCEESDFCLRAKALGYALRFQPAACVDHEGARQVAGKRFSAPYQYYHRLNSCVILIRHFGLSPVLWKFPLAIAAHSGRNLARAIGGALARFTMSLAGMAAGMLRGLLVYLRDGTDPIRRGADAEAIRNALRAQTALSTTDRPARR